jgi:hypothetical protein
MKKLFINNFAIVNGVFVSNDTDARDYDFK